MAAIFRSSDDEQVDLIDGDKGDTATGDINVAGEVRAWGSTGCTTRITGSAS
jgi:hypothetical protein